MGIFNWLFGNIEGKEENFSQELIDEIKKGKYPSKIILL